MTSVSGRWIRRKRREAIYARDQHRCVYCEATDCKLTLDHYRGRSNATENLVTACYSCNSSKQGKTINQWFKVLRSRGIDTRRVSRRIRWALRRR